MSKTLGFIGAGNMAEAMARGVVQADLFAKEAVVAADLAEERRRVFAEELGTRVTSDAGEVVREADVIVLAVKPQHLAAVLETVAPEVTLGKVFVSIVAGVPTARIESALGEGVRVVRVMPNTPMLVGEGMSALCAGRCATEDDVALAERICGCAGATVVVDEEHMDAVTAVSGSGPAYFFHMVEQMVEAGVAEGLDPDVALRLAKQTALGAARLMLAFDHSPAELRRRVTSLGGTTHAAFEVVEKHAADKTWVAAIRRAAARSRELGRR